MSEPAGPQKSSHRVRCINHRMDNAAAVASEAPAVPALMPDSVMQPTSPCPRGRGGGLWRRRGVRASSVACGVDRSSRVGSAQRTRSVRVGATRTRSGNAHTFRGGPGRAPGALVGAGGSVDGPSGDSESRASTGCERKGASWPESRAGRSRLAAAAGDCDGGPRLGRDPLDIGSVGDSTDSGSI